MDVNVLKQLHYQILRIRRIEERIADVYPEQEMRCPVHLCIGQEAVAVGVCAHLTPKDYVLSSHRAHGHYLAKGGDLKAMMAEMYGKVTGCSRGKGGSMHLVDLSAGFLGATPIVGSTIPIAVGAAFGAVMQEEDRIAVVFFGDGAIEEGVFHESLNFATLKNLPVVFVCENNLYSVYSPFQVRQPAGREIFELAKGHGIESYQGDGNDVLEVYKLGKAAVRKARRQEGPTFLEFKTYRWREHCGPYYDNDLGYRTEKEFEYWKQHCPLKKVEDQMLAEGHLTSADIENMIASLDKEIDAAINYAKNSPFPAKELLLEHVYAADKVPQILMND